MLALRHDVEERTTKARLEGIRQLDVGNAEDLNNIIEAHEILVTEALEQQLICICRAVLRHNSIVFLDEATANIDIVTEEKVQNLMNKSFKNSTVFTIDTESTLSSTVTKCWSSIKELTLSTATLRSWPVTPRLSSRSSLRRLNRKRRNEKEKKY